MHYASLTEKSRLDSEGNYINYQVHTQAVQATTVSMKVL